MPRPGPRPYECVRRAWHSDRHQPVRGSLIQEIFRVVNEIHGSATKKNKEYQEKLPVVVLRAEEIMYSKANSEVEYMDLTTLLERMNDAINTIIRCDETTETGEYLQPCIEAALNLGCSPKKASRGQRYSPSCYLTTRNQELPTVTHCTIQNPAGADHITKSQYGSHCLNLGKATTLKSTHLDSERQRSIFRNDDPVPVTNTLPLVSENPPSTSKKPCLEQQQLSSKLFSVYPLYYGNHVKFDESQHGSKIPHKSVCDTFGPTILGAAQTQLACGLNASNQRSQSLKRVDPKNPCSIECDLSLRLAPLSIPGPGVVHDRLQDTEDRSKFSDGDSQMDKNFYLLTGDKAYVTLDCFSSKLGFKDESLSVQPTARKRKADFINPLKNHQFCLQP